ncbi:hypothetical protein EJ06DRAFT_1016 [Trichodelitschia bisporula]|uniref:Uncharacterized protein n=1 Tax=Trichodelitschia bisporula TaxID=703511 RepID=A0A6G1I964_9PEZI|nr:hypothetical protein EJ06DRAFT_1016 [Trichodelitschia bisporula]
MGRREEGGPAGAGRARDRSRGDRLSQPMYSTISRRSSHACFAAEAAAAHPRAHTSPSPHAPKFHDWPALPQCFETPRTAYADRRLYIHRSEIGTATQLAHHTHILSTAPPALRNRPHRKSCSAHWGDVSWRCAAGDADLPVVSRDRRLGRGICIALQIAAGYFVRKAAGEERW